MAAIRLAPNVIVDLSDEGSAVIGGKTWHWTFHEYCGPTFTDETGEPLAKQPGANHRVWKAFAAWLRQQAYRKDYVRELSKGCSEDA